VLVDEFDEHAHNYAAYDDAGHVVGSVRVVPDGPLGLPLERCFPLNGYRDGKRLAEVSRLAVATGNRGASRLGMLLMKVAYQRYSAMRVSHVVLDAYVGDGTSTSLYDKMGFVHISEPYQDHEYLCPLPVVSFELDLARIHAEWPRTRPALYRFFTSPDTDIDHA